MIEAAEKTRTGGDLRELLSPEVRKALDRSREILDEAARIRASSWRHEDPIRDWVARTRLSAPKGRRWKSSFEEAMDLVARAGSLQTKIYHREQEALPHLRAAIAKLRVLGTGDERHLPPHTLERLEDCVRHRTEALEALDRALRLSERIVELRPRTPPEDLFTLLDERSRLLGEATSLKREADGALRRAFQPDEEPPPDLDEAAEIAVEKAREEKEPGGNGTVVEVVPAGEPSQAQAAEALEDEEWERWLRSARAEEEPEEAGGSREEEEEGTEAEATASAPAPGPSAGPGEAAGGPRPGTLASLLCHRVEVLEAELENTARAARRKAALQERERGREIERATAELERRVAEAERERDEARERVLRVERELSGREEARRELEEELAGLREDLEGARAGLETAERERDEARDRTARATRRLRIWRARLLAKKEEIERRAAERLAAREEELAREREGELAELRAGLEESLDAALEGRKAAERERDEALRLVTSLARRLEAAGLSGEDGEEISTFSDEIAKVRRTLWCQENELQALRNLLIAWKEEIGAQFTDLGYIRSKLGEELIET